MLKITKDKALAATVVTVIIMLAGVAASTVTYHSAKGAVKAAFSGTDKAYNILIGKTVKDEEPEEEEGQEWYEEGEYVPRAIPGKAVFNKDKVKLYLNHIYEDEYVEVDLSDRGVLTLADFEYRKGYDVWYLVDIYEGTDPVASDYINRWQNSYRWVNGKDLDPYYE